MGKTLGVWGRDYCAGAYPGFQRGGGGGGVPTLCFNRYMSWEGGGIAVRLWLYTKSGGGGGGGGGGVQGWRHFICYGRGSRCPPPPPRPGPTGNRGGGGGGPCNMSLATRQIRVRSGFPHLHNKISFVRGGGGGGGGGGFRAMLKLLLIHACCVGVWGRGYCMCGWGKRLLCVGGGIGYCVCGGVRGTL